MSQVQRSDDQAASHRLWALQTILDETLHPLAQEDTIRELLKRSCLALPADLAVLLLLSEDGQHLVCHASHGLNTALVQAARIPLGQDLAGRIAVQRQPLQAEDLTQVEAQSPLLGTPLHSAMGVPLLVESQMLGVLLVATVQPRHFGEEDLRLLQLAGNRAAAVLEHARLFEQVRAGRERSQMLAQQLLEAQEAERRRLARELHDEIGQALTAVKINLQSLRQTPGETAARLDESIGIVDRALQQVRSLSLDLRPSLLDDLGLVAALRWYLDRQAQRAGFAAEFTADPPGFRAATELETACFRVAQEALTNIVRHAQARRVGVELRQREAELQLRIRDDGVGFDLPAARQRAIRGASLGLLGMQERVGLLRGRLDIQSARGQGTTVQVRLPLMAGAPLERRRRRRDSG